MAYAAMTNLAYQDLVTEEHLDRMRENIEHLASLKAFGTALSNVAAASEIGSRVAIGTYVGNSTNDRAITGIGFRPKYVRILYGTNSAWEASRNSPLPMLYSIDSMDTDGFTVSHDFPYSGVSSNANGTNYHYVCVE